MTSDAVESLRAELAGLHGPARAVPLLKLGQALADRYWRAGIGSPTARRELDAAVEAVDEAYGYLEPGDLLRGQAAAVLGWLLGMRHGVHGGATRDRETGIHLLEEAVAFPSLPPMQASVARIALGQMYLSRTTESLKDSSSVFAAMRSGTKPRGFGDVDRAVACFREVLDGPVFSAELTGAAQAMLKMAEALRTMLGAVGQGAAGMDFGRLMEAMGAMQDLQRMATSGGLGARGPGLPVMPSFFEAERIVNLDPLDRPVAVLRGEEPAAPAAPRPRMPVTLDVAALRRELPDLAVMLDATEPLPELDTLVATAATIVHSGQSEPADHLRLAAAFYLRSRLDDGDGWGDGGTSRDVSAAVACLAGAATPELPAAAVPALLRLAVALDALDAVAGRFTTVVDALRAVGAGVLVYPGLGMLDAATGRIRPIGSLPRRVLVVGLPDHSAIPSGEAVVSYVPSDAMVVDLAARTPARLPWRVVFVANPRGDRDAATVEAMALRRAFYPRAITLGRAAENADGPGTPDEVLAHLDASLLDLGCGSTADGALELAGAAELPAAAIAAHRRRTGGLAILTGDSGGSVALADALLAAGYTGVIGWRRPVPAPVASVVHVMLHSQLTGQGLAPASAVHHVRQWMRDADRPVPPPLPGWHMPPVGPADLADERHWAALVHWGR
jgi:hypothetical protein